MKSSRGCHSSLKEIKAICQNVKFANPSETVFAGVFPDKALLICLNAKLGTSDGILLFNKWHNKTKI
ncbi:MAG: hypothetical protein K2Q15_04465, partial [Burkholderiales bacterium]|nr:hypothetical protein [Burkholderiales bacterium]